MMKHSSLLFTPLCAPFVLVAAAATACGGSVSSTQGTNTMNQNEGDAGGSSSGGSSGSSGGSSGSSSGAGTSSGSGGSSGGVSGSSSSGGPSGSGSGGTSSGSGVITVPLQACLPLVYTANVTIGSQTFAMNLDTGSTSLGVASTACTGCGVTPEYSPGATAVDRGTMAMSQYGSGSWTGEVYQDSVGFASDPMIPLDFVAIDTQSMFFTQGIQCGATGQGYQGIIGFDRASAAVSGTNAFFDQYVLAKGIANVFATELCDSGGTLWLGGYDTTTATAAPQFTPVTTDAASTYYYTVDLETVAVAGTSTPVTIAVGQYPDTVVDTGTSGFVVPTAVFNSLASAIAGTPGFQMAFGANAGAAWFSTQPIACGAAGMTKAQIDAALPALTLSFGAAPGLTIQVPPSESYLINYGQYGWCSTMIQIQQGQQFPLAAIMGAPFLRSQITIYDRANNQIGFAPHGACP